jgi:hypothetical protein
MIAICSTSSYGRLPLKQHKKNSWKKHPSTDQKYYSTSQKHTSKNLQKHYESKADGIPCNPNPCPLVWLVKCQMGWVNFLLFNFFSICCIERIGSFSKKNSMISQINTIINFKNFQIPLWGQEATKFVGKKTPIWDICTKTYVD